MRREVIRALVLAGSFAPVLATAGAQPAPNCCAQVLVAGSESSVLVPASRHFRIWIEPASDIFGWRGNFPTAVREAFDAWNAAGLPVEFSYTTDSSEANLFVFWRRDFKERVRGRSTWWTEVPAGYVRGEIEIAVLPYDGSLPESSLIRAIAMHEIGHLLGLRHNNDQGSVMSRTVRVRYLPRADIRRAHTLYASLAPRAEHE